MYTTPPITGFIVLSVIGILLLATTIPLLAFGVYDRTGVTTVQADTAGDAKINAQTDTP